VQINGGAVSRSGPQYGGSPAHDRSYDAAEGCRNQQGGPCQGYGEVPSSQTHGGSGGSSSERRRFSNPPGGGSSSGTSSGGGAFCTTHQCIPSFSEGTGTIVQCADGEWSHSGGRPGVCSRHGGVKE
jgi:hypothetical protein